VSRPPEERWPSLYLRDVSTVGETSGGDAPVSRSSEMDSGRLEDEFRHRIRNQAHDHWLEFSIIVAGANVLLALGFGGQILDHLDRPVWTTALLVLVLTASLAAVALAYYSIQVGPLITVGRMRFWDVVLSFTIAAAQLSLFLWPIHLLSSGTEDDELAPYLRWWLFAFIAFAVTAILASQTSARARRVIVGVVFTAFESGQSKDRRAAAGAAAAVGFCFSFSFVFPTAMIWIGAVIVLVAASKGALSQSTQAAALEVALSATAPSKDSEPQPTTTGVATGGRSAVFVWQVASAVTVLLMSLAWSLALFASVNTDAPLRPSAGRILVEATTDQASTSTRVNVLVSAALDTADPTYGKIVVDVFTSDPSRRLTTVRLLLCGPLRALTNAKDPLEPTASVDPGLEVVDLPAALGGIAVDGQALGDCKVVNLRSQGGQVYAYSAVNSVGWGSRSGSLVLWTAPSVTPLIGFGGVPVSGSTSLEQRPTDLINAFGSPTTNTSGTAWDWSSTTHIPQDYRLTGTLQSIANQTQRSNLLLGLSLGLVAGAFVWLLATVVTAVALRGTPTSQPIESNARPLSQEAIANGQAPPPSHDPKTGLSRSVDDAALVVPPSGESARAQTGPPEEPQT
jgi:hypothetical protein